MSVRKGFVGKKHEHETQPLSCRYPMFYILQVAQLSQRDRAAGWVNNGQKWKTGTGRQYLRTISIYIQPLRDIWPAKQSKLAKKTRNKGYYAVQGHPRSSRSVPIDSPYVTSY